MTLHVAMSSWMQLRRIVIMMIIEYPVPSLARNCPRKSTKSFTKVFTFICVHAGETNTHARVNLYEMSIYKSCWSWSVSQFSTCMSLLRHGCQRNSLWNSQTDGQMYTFPDQMNWQFVQILIDSKFHSRLRAVDTWRKAKDYFVFCSRKICLVSFKGCWRISCHFVVLVVLCHLNWKLLVIHRLYM